MGQPEAGPALVRVAPVQQEQWAPAQVVVEMVGVSAIPELELELAMDLAGVLGPAAVPAVEGLAAAPAITELASSEDPRYDDPSPLLPPLLSHHPISQRDHNV